MHAQNTGTHASPVASLASLASPHQLGKRACERGLWRVAWVCLLAALEGFTFRTHPPTLVFAAVSFAPSCAAFFFCGPGGVFRAALNGFGPHGIRM